MITEEHQKAIAEIIKKGIEIPSVTDPHSMFAKGMDRTGRDIGIGIANYFATDNPKFDYTKFMVDCELE